MGGDGSAAEAIVRSRAGKSLREFGPGSEPGSFAGRRVSCVAGPEPHPSLRAMLQAGQTTPVIARASGGGGSAALRPEPMFPHADPVIHIAARVPAMSRGFQWGSAYADLKVRTEQVRANGDTYAICAYDAAIEAIGTRVMEVYRHHASAGSEKGVFEPVAAHGALLRLAERAESSPESADEASALREALRKIDTITGRMHFELGMRDREFAAVAASVPTGHSCFAPNREGLNRWLGHEVRLAESTAQRAFERSDLAAAVPASLHGEYFQRLMVPANGESDCWTISRALIMQAVYKGDLVRVRALSAAHGRLVRAMADRALQTTAESIDSPVGPLVRAADWADEPVPGADPFPETGASFPSARKVPPGFNWFDCYHRLRARRDRAAQQSDSFMRIAYSGAIESIEAAVMKAYRTFPWPADVTPEQAYQRLTLLQVEYQVSLTAKLRGKSLLSSIDRLTCRKQTVLALWQLNRLSCAATGNPGTSGYFQVAPAPRQFIVQQLAQGQPLSRGQAGDIAWRANLADSLGWPHTSGYGVMRNLPGQLARLSGSAEPSTDGPFSVGRPGLEEFDGVLAAIESAGCL